jgi:hypothetical protein
LEKNPKFHAEYAEYSEFDKFDEFDEFDEFAELPNSEQRLLGFFFRAPSSLGLA